MKVVIVLLTLTAATMALTDFQITDFSTAHIITISKGLAKIQDVTFKLIHLINVELYEQFLAEVKQFMDKNTQTNSIFYSTLKQEIEQTKEAIKFIKPSGRKIRRSINILGTAWKYLAGTPDHDDFAALEYDTKQLNDNNNKQFLLNQALTERMNNLTVITDRLTNAITKDSYFNDELVISIQNRLRLVKEEIVNVRYAIQWAKL
ncbi:uncharacterized protein LOC120772864 [Bactrocera tryoni]|uniref:uncharacterized protein LOC120772864 n=1 Tax=Bactrocera tryoni TaxID=59916 RepID=UPI001A95E04A|nr:uncharacterized protein LOC120772864 [Bactrocera tryoni]